MTLTRQAQLLNPLHAGWYYFSHVRLHYSTRNYAAAIADIQRAGMPDFYWTHVLMATARSQPGLADAYASLARIRIINPGLSARAELRKWNAAADDLENIMGGLHKAGLVE